MIWLETLRQQLQRDLAAHEASDDLEEGMLRELCSFVRDFPDCCSRELAVGHITAAAWILNPSLDQVVLLHHGKLHRWLQPGGHLEPRDVSVQAAALREAREETGLVDLLPLQGGFGGIFDVDVHEIPRRGAEPAHLHFDVRYAFMAAPGQELAISAESRELGWFDLEAAAQISNSESVVRMVRKTPQLGRRRAAN